eukprot:GHVL01020523.1.p1 GENE.GHVL01020523.1~~GHVL01020523.1.p1  ORF type:complete len:631 (+),score=119.21 GHVL01020523.1:31-1893(+)
MPIVNLDKSQFLAKLGQQYDETQFQDLCFEFGIELDEVTSEKEMIMKEKGEEAAKNASDAEIWKVDIPANRYDLLCIEGIARSLRIFCNKEKPPQYTLTNVVHTITVKSQTKLVRPFIVGAVLRNIKFNKEIYDSFLDLQDKLHQNICRRRVLVAIGTHDLDSIEGPFTYEALPPKDIKFTPLKRTTEVDGGELMDILSSDMKLKSYLPIIRDSPVYPVVYDMNKNVCSLPPIINGELSKLSMSTKNIFIECTCTDLTKGEIVLNTLVTMFSEYCGNQFEIEPVRVVYEETNKEFVYPDLSQREIILDTEYIRSLSGIPNLENDKIIECLYRMSIICYNKNNILYSIIPSTRSDILHLCDLAEDVSIAYGYNNIISNIAYTMNWPYEQNINHISDQCRRELGYSGYNECLSWGLCSYNECFLNMNRNHENNKTINKNQYMSSLSPVRLSNPKTICFEIVRTSLLPMLLKSCASNRSQPLPLNMFEVGDVVVQDDSTEVGATNIRRVAAVHLNVVAGFEIIHGLLDTILKKLKLKPAYGETAETADSSNLEYYLKTNNDPAFLTGRRADIIVRSTTQSTIQMKPLIIGVIGVVHPECLRNFDVAHPVSAFEFNLEPFLDWL